MSKDNAEVKNASQPANKAAEAQKSKQSKSSLSERFLLLKATSYFLVLSFVK